MERSRMQTASSHGGICSKDVQGRFRRRPHAVTRCAGRCTRFASHSHKKTVHAVTRHRQQGIDQSGMLGFGSMQRGGNRMTTAAVSSGPRRSRS